MKTDARVRYTRKIIQETFLDLLKDKPISKITVKEICDKAEINRGTFYKHYQDCYDLLEKIEAEGIQEFEKMLAAIEATGAHAAVIAILNTLRSKSQLIQSIITPMSEQQFIQKLSECCLLYIGQWLGSTPESGCPIAKQNASFAFLAGGCSSVIQWWLQNGMQDPPEEIADYIITFSKQITKGLSN